MTGLVNLEKWQRENVARECINAVREAIWYGLDANDLKHLMADCWREVLEEKALLGEAELRSK